jgi:hypothetical protein
MSRLVILLGLLASLGYAEATISSKPTQVPQRLDQGSHELRRMTDVGSSTNRSQAELLFQRVFVADILGGGR